MPSILHSGKAPAKRALNAARLNGAVRIGPILHHASPLLGILCVVVGRTDCVRVDMGQLRVHPFLRMAHLMQGGGDGPPNTVPGRPVLQAHALERAVEHVLAERLPEVQSLGKR